MNDKRKASVYDKRKASVSDKRKALTSAALCSIWALIGIVVSIVNIDKLAGTTVFILIICSVIVSVGGAVIWLVRYAKLSKANE